MNGKTKNYVDRMRVKPRHQQQKHAGFIALAVTGALFLLWLPLLSVNIKNGLDGEVARGDKADMQLFKGGVASVASGFRQSYDVLRGTAAGYGSIEYNRTAEDVADDEPYGPALTAEPVEWFDE